MHPSPFIFQAPGEMHFGPGTAARAGERLARLGARRVLLITDAQLHRLGVTEPVIRSLQAASLAYSLFTEVEENPSITTCERAAAQFRADDCDAILAVGGGSSMDTAKAAGVLAHNSGPLRRYEGADKFAHDLPLLACVPTTAGTASEVTFNAVITDPADRFKFPIISPRLAPRLALVDPELTLSKPAGLTAATGVDALTHAIESYTNNNYHRVSRIYAAEAIRLIGAHLRGAVWNGRDLEARSEMLLASLLAGYAFNANGLGLVHAMSHPLSGHFGVPHGVANAILLTRVMAWNLPACVQRTAEIAVLMGERVEGLSTLDAAHKAVAAVQRLARDVGIPDTLDDVGVPRSAIPMLAEDAMKSRLPGMNARRNTIQDVVRLYEQCFRGTGES